MTTLSEVQLPIEQKWIFKTLVYIPIFLLLLLPSLLGGNDSDFIKATVYFVFLAIAAPINLVMMILSRKNFHFALEDEYIFIRQGVFSKKETHIAYSMIQNVLVTQDLFDRLFQLSTVVIENGVQQGASAKNSSGRMFGFGRKMNTTNDIGISGNKMSIPGLSPEHAAQLRDAVLEKVAANPPTTNTFGV